MVEIKESPINYLKSDFNSEREFVDYIEINIKKFCFDCLGEVYKSHIREYPLQSHKRKSKRIDLLVTTVSGLKIIIEAKKPKHICELQYCVGQLIFYSTLFKKHTNQDSRLVIATTKFDDELIETFKQFNLPITMIGLSKTEHILHNISHLN